MSSTSPSGSHVDPNNKTEPTFPFVEHIPTVHEKIFKAFDSITSSINAACNALIFDKQALPDFVRENRQWRVMCYYIDETSPPVVYLHWDYETRGGPTHKKAYREYIDYLRNNVIQFEEHVTSFGSFELRLTRPCFRLDVQSPLPRQTNFTPPDVVASPITSQ